MPTQDNVTYGKPGSGGAIYSAPADRFAEQMQNSVAVAYKPRLYREDGLPTQIRLKSETIKAWGGDTVLVSQTDKPDTLSLYA